MRNRYSKIILDAFIADGRREGVVHHEELEKYASAKSASRALQTYTRNHPEYPVRVLTRTIRGRMEVILTRTDLPCESTKTPESNTYRGYKVESTSKQLMEAISCHICNRLIAAHTIVYAISYRAPFNKITLAVHKDCWKQQTARGA